MTTAKLARYPGVQYSYVAKIEAEWRAIGQQCFARVAYIPGESLFELRVDAIYAEYIVFAIPNAHGGCRYVWMTHEEVEYPLYSIACRALAEAEAKQLYPIVEVAGKKTKKQQELSEHQERLREEYVTDHWIDFYDRGIESMKAFTVRQPTEPADMLPMYVGLTNDFARQLREMAAYAQELERRLKEPVVKRLVCGLCICETTDQIQRCRFAAYSTVG